MFRFEVRRFLYAGLFLCPFLLASTPDFAQETRRSMDPPLSIISLAPAPRPQGEMLARHPGDATFEHAPANYHVFAAASVDMDAGVEVLTLNFAAETRLNHIESKNKDFVIEPGGTCREGNSYTRGDACSLLVRFNPQGPGHRLGFINISHSDEPKSVLFGLVGNGSAPVVSFIPAVITTVPGTYTSNAGTIKTATNLAIDGGDILYIADTGNDHVKEIDSSGVIDSVTTEFGTPAAVAVDSLGTFYTTNTQSSTDYFAYYLPWGAATGFSNPAKPGSCTPSAPCPVSTVGMINPANVTIDGSDNLFFEEENKGAAEMPVSSLAGGDASFDLWYLNDQFAYTNPSPSAFAVDANDNLYTDYTDSAAGVCFLVEESVYAAETSPTANRVAGGSACGFSGDGAQARGAEISNNIGQIAFDLAGNLYFTDTGNQRVRRIDAATGIINTIAGDGTAGYTGDGGRATTAELDNPTGVAVDSSGQVYIISSATTNQVIRKLTTQGIISFLAQLENTTSPSSIIRTVTVSNTGDAALVLTNYDFTGTNPGDFSIDPATTSCILTSGSTLAAGQSCKIGFLFKPAGTGARSANLVLNDNTITNENTILLIGYGTQLTLSPTSLAFSSEAVGSSTASKAVTLTNPGSSTLSISSIAITGTNATSFLLTNGCGSTLAAGAHCTMSVVFHPATTGALTAAITITDNGGNSPQSVPLTGTGTAASIKQMPFKLKPSTLPQAEVQ